MRGRANVQLNYLHHSANFIFFIKIKCNQAINKQSMINTIQDRPQSKNQRTQLQRPPTRNINAEQAQKCYLMARQHQTRKQYNQAIKHYTEAVMHNPQHYQAYCNVGIIYRDLQNFKQAIASYQKALSIKGDDYKTIYNLANAYRLIGDPEKACDLYNYVVQKGDIPNLRISSLNNLGICYQDMLKFESAVGFYEKVIQAQPNYEGGYYNKAVCLVYLVRKMDKTYKTRFLRIQQAEKLFNRVIREINPNNIMAKVYLQELKYLKNDSKQAFKSCLDELNRILQNEKKMTSQIQDEINRKIGVCLAGLQRYQESAKHFKDGVKQIKKDISRKSSVANANSTVNLNLNQYDSVNQPSQNNNFNISNPINKKTESSYIQNETNAMKKKGSEGSDILDMSSQLNGDMSPLKTSVKITDQRSLTKSEIEQQQQKIKIRQQQENRDKLNIIIGQIYSFCNQKQFDKAIQILKEQVPQGKVRIQQKIKILSKQAQHQQKKQYASNAIESYKFNFLLKNSSQKKSEESFNDAKNTDVSIETHQAIAQCYTLLGQHKNAIMHYGFVNQWYEENHKLDEKYVQSQSAISLNYQNLGLLDQAMECYRKALKLNPYSFDLNYNLANCYQQANMIDEGISTYRKCLHIISQSKNKQPEKGNQKWFKEGDCLLNLSICYGILMNPREQLSSLEKAMNIFDENCNSIQQLIENYDKKFLLDIYLQLANLYQSFLDQSRGEIASDQLQKTKEKLLSTYLVLLQFQECPDRQQIILNCGNILYQQKLYLNSLQYYKQLNPQKSSNYLGITNLKINQFSTAYASLVNSLKLDQQNSIFYINFALVDWIFSEKVAQSPINNQNIKNITAFQEEFPCQSDHLFEYRLLFAIQFIDQLTIVLSSEESNKLKTPIEECNSAIKATIFCLRESIKMPEFNRLSGQLKARIKTRQLVFSKLDQYNNNRQKVQQTSKLVLITQKDVNIVTKTSKMIKEDFEYLIQRLKDVCQSKKGYLGYFPSLVQTMMTLFIISNRSQIVKIRQILIQNISSLSSPNLYAFLNKETVQKLKMKKQLDKKYLQKIVMKQPILLEDLVQQMQQWELKAQAKYSPLFEQIKQIYWESLPQQDIKYVSYPYKIEWNIPKCQNVFQCEDCMLKLATIAKRIFGKQQEYQNNLKQDNKNSIKQKIMSAMEVTYFSNQLKNANNTDFQLTAGNEFHPLTLHFYYWNSQAIVSFIEKCLTQLQSNSEFKIVSFLQSSIKQNQSEAILINNLIKIEFHLGQRDFISQYCKKAIEFPLGIQTIALMTLQGTDTISFPNSAKEGWLQQYKKGIQ